MLLNKILRRTYIYILCTLSAIGRYWFPLKRHHRHARHWSNQIPFSVYYISQISYLSYLLGTIWLVIMKCNTKINVLDVRTFLKYEKYNLNNIL